MELSYFSSSKIQKHFIKRRIKCGSASLADYVKNNLCDSVRYVRNNSKQVEEKKNIDSLVSLIEPVLSKEGAERIYKSRINYCEDKKSDCTFYIFESYCIPPVLIILSAITDPMRTSNVSNFLDNNAGVIAGAGLSALAITSILFWSVGESYKDKAEELRSDRDCLLRSFSRQ